MRMNRLLTKYFPWSLAALGTLSSACSARSTDGPAEQSQQASTTDGVLRPPSKLGASPSPNGGALPSSSLPTYGGGPILSPEIVSLYWGNFSDSQKQGMQTYLQGLATFISGSTSPPAQEPAREPAREARGGREEALVARVVTPHAGARQYTKRTMLRWRGRGVWAQVLR